MFRRALIAAVTLACVATPATADDNHDHGSAEVAPADLSLVGPELPSTEQIRELVRLSLNYERSLHQTAALTAKADTAETTAAEARSAAAAESSIVVDYVMSGQTNPMNRGLDVIRSSASADEMLQRVMTQEQIIELQRERLTRAQRLDARAKTLEAEAANLRYQAERASKRANATLTKVAAAAEDMGLGESQMPENLPADQTEQAEWNASATTRWQEYTENRPAPKTKAAALKNPTDLPDGLTPVTVKGKTVPGVARKPGLEQSLVLPRSTVALVNGAHARLGKPFTTSSKTALGLRCDTLFTGIRGAPRLPGTITGLYEQTKKVDPQTRQIGDLIFTAKPESGLTHVGLYIGGDRMIDAPSARHTVGVSRVPTDIYAITRPSLGPGNNTAPPVAEDARPYVCGSPEPAPKDSGWTLPMKRGTYQFSASFGQAGKMWSSGFHTGTDFAAPLGTPIYAARAGTASITRTSWAGPLITISRDDGTKDLYAHSSDVLIEDGDTVTAGQKIALIGSEGNSSGPHLHFEIHVNGEPVDAMPLMVQSLAVGVGDDAWGGYGNGLIPLTVLCKTPGGNSVRCDVADRFQAMARAYRKETGRALKDTGAYRPIVEQIELDSDGNLVDLPGTSPFGWASRLSLPPGSADWVSRNAARFDLKPTADGVQALGN